MTVSQEIEKALDLYRQYGRAMVEDRELVPLIGRYEALIRRSTLTMGQVGVVAACTSCAENEPGGCCFRGVEEWYDAYLLLINLLLGRELPQKHSYAEGCLFVGGQGCKLSSRHSFCMNFLCPGLLNRLAPAQQMKLTRAIGEELQACWDLEKALREWLKQKGVVSK